MFKDDVDIMRTKTKVKEHRICVFCKQWITPYMYVGYNPVCADCFQTYLNLKDNIFIKEVEQ